MGAVEHAPGHYPAIVVMHGLWLIGLWVLAHDATVSWPLIAVFAILQAGRVWTIREPRCALDHADHHPCPARRRSAPARYRYLTHPNYWIVIGEIAILPLAFGLPLYALGFTVANAILLAIRIRAENRALAVADSRSMITTT